MVIAARKKGNLCGQGAAAKLGWVHGIGNPEGRLGDGALFTFPYFKVHFVCVCGGSVICAYMYMYLCVVCVWDVSVCVHVVCTYGVGVCL